MDRVKFEPLERADLEDIKALTDLAYEYDQRALGALLGAADLSANDGGLLSGPSLSYVHATGLLTLSSFSFLEITAGGAPLDSNGNSLSPEARVIRFDSSASSHNEYPIDISGARTVGTTYTLYARSIQVASDTSARRRWDVSSSQEVSYSPTTRFRERVDFRASVTKPAETTSADTGQWTPLLTYEVDSGGALTHTYISALDHADARAQSLLDPTNTADKLSSANLLEPTSLSAGSTESATHGLLSLISALKSLVYQVQSKGAADTLYTAPSSLRWSSGPLISLGEAQARLAQIETRTAGLNNTFPFSVEVQFSRNAGAAVENVRISQSNFSPFTNELTVAFDNRYRANGALPTAYDPANETIASLLRRIGHPVFIFDSSFNGGEVMMFSCCHTTHTLSNSGNTRTQWGSIAGSFDGAASKNIAFSFLEETDLPNGTTPAPRASLIGSRSYYDDSAALQTVDYAFKIAAYIDTADLSTDPAENEGLTLTLNYMFLVRR